MSLPPEAISRAFAGTLFPPLSPASAGSVKMWRVPGVSLAMAVGLMACMSDDSYVPMTAAVAPATLGEATVLPVNAAAQQAPQSAGRSAPLTPPLFSGGSQRIVLSPLQTRFVTDNRGVVTPDGRTDNDGQAVFQVLPGGVRLGGALVAPVCRLAGTDPGPASGTIQYDLKAGAASSNGDRQCSATLSDDTQLGATYSWESTASWSGGRLVLSGRATAVRTNSNRSPNDAEHLQVEEQATLLISGGRCTLESYRLVERKSRPNSAYFTHRTHVSTEQPLPGATCRFN